MRRLQKGQEPPILVANRAKWAAAYALKKTDYYKFKYRDPQIKHALVSETAAAGDRYAS